MTGRITKPSQNKQSLLMASGPRWIWLENTTDSNPVELLMHMTMPADFTRADSLDLHLVLEFDNDVSSGNQELLSVEVRDAPTSPTWSRSVTINRAADANRRVEQFLNLAPLLNSDGENWVVVKVPTHSWGRVHLFKLDSLVRTAGIA